ncbi:MAG: hypothetical protein J0L88_00585 [Xanthomonadales bacterium]|nr:hypothetical protein [Xanthomonadales bacterium]
MQTLLLNLRHVPDDEADEVRALLDANAIAFYETAPNRWGISAGAIWVRDDADAVRAKELLAEYQQGRRERGRAEWDEAKRDGTAPTWASQLRESPLRVIVILAAILGVIALSLWPLLLRG